MHPPGHRRHLNRDALPAARDVAAMGGGGGGGVHDAPPPDARAAGRGGPDRADAPRRGHGGTVAAERELAARVFHYLVTPSGTKVAHALPDLAEYADADERAATGRRRSPAGRSGFCARWQTPRPRVRQHLRDLPRRVAAPILDWRHRHVAATQRAEADGSGARRRNVPKRSGAGRGSSAASRSPPHCWRWWSASSPFAVRANQTTHSRELAASAISALAVDPSESVRLAAEALDTRETPEAEEALRRALEESRLRAVMTATRLGEHGELQPERPRIVRPATMASSTVDAGTGRPVAMFADMRARSTPPCSTARDGDSSPPGRTVRAGRDARTGRALLTLRPQAEVLDSRSSRSARTASASSRPAGRWRRRVGRPDGSSNEDPSRRLRAGLCRDGQP